MIINPRTILKEKVLIASTDAFPIDEHKQIQPNGVDVRIGRVLLMEPPINNTHQSEKNSAIVIINDNKKIFPNTTRIGSFIRDREKEVILNKGKTYSIETLEYVNLTKEISCKFCLRSSFTRCGVMYTNGWWDSGFSGLIATTIIPSFDMKITLGHRIGQVIFFKSDSAFLYNGNYQNQDFNVPLQNKL